MTEKMTYVKAVEFVLNDENLPADVRERLTALHDSLVKRASAERKPTKAQRASAEARDSIPERMEVGVLYSATEIGKMFNQSSQWAAPKLNALVSSGVLVKTVDKRKTYFSLA